MSHGTPKEKSSSKATLQTAMDILEDSRWKNQIKKIADFGCGKMRFLKLMRSSDSLEHILNVDIDEATLQLYQSRAQPLITDHLKERNCPLKIEILKGNFIYAVENLRNVDAVIALNVIDHLTTEVLRKAHNNVFGFIQPKLVILSTNRNFKCIQRKCKNWAKVLCDQYLNYSFDHLTINNATEIVIFKRNDLIGRPLVTTIKINLKADNRPEVQYKEIYAIDFPFIIDRRTKIEKIQAEILRHIENAHRAEQSFNYERCIYQISLQPLLDYAESINASSEDVFNVIKSLKFETEQQFLILTETYIVENFNCCLDEDYLDIVPYRGYFHNSFRRRYFDNHDSNTIDNDDEEDWD